MMRFLTRALPALATALALSGPAVAADGLVPVTKVVAAFKDICIDTAPSYSAAKGRLGRYGLTNRDGDGVIYHASRTHSVKLPDAPGRAGSGALRCSMVYEDPDKPAAEGAINKMIASFGGAVQGRRDVSVPAGNGTRPGTMWTVQIAGRRATILHMPFSTQNGLGGLIVRVPAQ